MTRSTRLRPALAPALALALVACGGPDREPVATPAPSQPQEQARGDAGPDGDALRAPSRPDGETRQQREAPSTPAPDAAPGFAEGHPMPDAARRLLGEWTVAGHRFGAVSAMDDAGASRLHGREVSYGDAHASSGADSCVSPRYAAQERNVVESLLIDYRTSPAELGLDQATDAQVTVVDIECASPWATLGSRVLVMPDGLVLAPWDGVFFELRPR